MLLEVRAREAGKSGRYGRQTRCPSIVEAADPGPFRAVAKLTYACGGKPSKIRLLNGS